MHKAKPRTRKKQLERTDRIELGKFGDFVRLVKEGMGARQAYAEVYGEIIADWINQKPSHPGAGE